MKQKRKNSSGVLSLRKSVVVGLAIAFLSVSSTLFTGQLKADDKAPKVASSKHQQRGGMECRDCHGETPPKPLSSRDCLSCHESAEALAAATARLNPNPHDSPHYGKELDCDLCHHEHCASESFCAQCHDWTLAVP